MGIQGFPTVKVFHPTFVDPTGNMVTKQTITGKLNNFIYIIYIYIYYILYTFKYLFIYNK